VRIRPAPGARADRAKADFEQFVAASSDALLRTAYLVVWDPVEAEDLVQDCLLAVATRRGRWPRSPTSPPLAACTPSGCAPS
jgi:DNA-directed RNA polymerase specialized sigma24 family protein